ncbi:MAG: FAD-binding oxidoreductase [Acidobacteriaceae bacterium]
MARQLYTARLEEKLLLSEPTQCFHLEFSVPELDSFDFTAGQFVSAVAEDSNGKQQTRAYSIASAARGNRFDLCVNRVEGGFFSNKLCDLEPGQEVRFHGPHGLFLLRQPFTDSILIATGTGIAPMRSFTQRLFPELGGDYSEGRHIWLVYGTRYPTEIYYQKYFETLAAEHSNFHYLSSLSRPREGWEGLRGYVQDHVAEVLKGRSNGFHPPPTAESAAFDIHAYICGLNEMVSCNRDRLVEMGWHKKQVVFERYD